MKPEPEGPSELEELAAKALRPTRRIGAEDLVASELASAVLSDPLAKIRHVCEALMILDEGEKAQAKITEKDEEEAEKIYVLAVSLANIHTNKEVDSSGQVYDSRCSIPWPFTLEEAGDWLDWATRQGKTAEDIYNMTSGETTIQNGRTMLTRFLRYAMPKATVLMKKIIRLVSPDSYIQALQILRGGKIGKQEPRFRKPKA